MQKFFQKMFGQAGRLDADQEAANAVAVAASKKVRKDKESGATAIEYGLIAALIAVAIITAITSVGDNMSDTFNDVADNMA